MNDDLYHRLLGIAQRQFIHNANRNIFAKGALTLSEETRTFLREYGAGIDALPQEQRLRLFEQLADGFVRSFTRINQYINFSADHLRQIVDIYSALFQDIYSGLDEHAIEQAHYDRIRWMVANSNPDIKKLNNTGEWAQQAAAAEYTAEFQLQLYGISLSRLMQPVLDIGCGSNAELVSMLRGEGIEAYGIDRHVSKPGCTIANWLEYDYGSRKWGTVLANLSFSSHFLHSLYHNTALLPNYARTYFNILLSLKKDGKWYYAPSLPQVEDMLDSLYFSVSRREILGKYSLSEITAI